MYFQRSKKRQPNSTSGEPSTSRAPNATSTTPVKSQPYRSVNTYLDRIPIAGVHNYLYAQGKFEKIAWNLTFLLAIAGTLYYLVPTVQQYLKFTIVLEIQHQTAPSVRLPNPWVCHSGVNVTYVKEQFEKVKPQLEADKRVKVIAQRYQKMWEREYQRTDPVTVDQLINIALIFIMGEDNGMNFFRPQLAYEFISIAIQAMGPSWAGFKSLYEDGMFDCQTIVKNCQLNGVPFDCCRDGPMGYSRGFDKCFALDIRRVVSERKLQNQPTELRFETLVKSPSTASSSEDISAWLSTVSFGNRIASLFDATQIMPGISESTITVRSTKKVRLANCMEAYKYRPQMHSTTHPLIRKYFEEMTIPDRYSMEACQMGKLFEILFVKCGCVMYYDSMRPQNDTDICTPVQLNVCVYAAFQNDPPVSADSNDAQSYHSSAQDEVKRDLFQNIKELIATECLQLCESWIYDYTIFSSDIDDLDMSSINSTKVTIVFDPEYRLETEMYKMDPSAFIASLSSGLMLILGCSGITLVQLPIWSIVACLYKRKQMKVSAVSK